MMSLLDEFFSGGFYPCEGHGGQRRPAVLNSESSNALDSRQDGFTVLLSEASEMIGIRPIEVQRLVDHVPLDTELRGKDLYLKAEDVRKFRKLRESRLNKQEVRDGYFFSGDSIAVYAAQERITKHTDWPDYPYNKEQIKKLRAEIDLLSEC